MAAVKAAAAATAAAVVGFAVVAPPSCGPVSVLVPVPAEATMGGPEEDEEGVRALRSRPFIRFLRFLMTRLSGDPGTGG